MCTESNRTLVKDSLLESSLLSGDGVVAAVTRRRFDCLAVLEDDGLCRLVLLVIFGFLLLGALDALRLDSIVTVMLVALLWIQEARD